jgi:formylglycine-generating enzyme required for sulfatase activity
MHGNVYEWCADPWHKNYEEAPSSGSVWLEGENKGYYILRGGSVGSEHSDCRSAFRNYDFVVHNLMYVNVGFRVVCEVGRIDS